MKGLSLALTQEVFVRQACQARIVTICQLLIFHVRLF